MGMDRILQPALPQTFQSSEISTVVMSNILRALCFLSILSFLLAATTAGSLGSSITQQSVGVSEFCKEHSSFSRSRLLQNALRIRGGSSSVVHVASAAEFDKLVLESDGKLIVVDFSATWCMPCKLIAPVFDEMSSPDGEFANVIFVKIDVDEVPELAERFQVQAMPTFLFMRNSEEVDRFSGASVEKLKETIIAHSN